MAEFALGLAKTAVSGTVSKVKLAIEEEAKLRVRVQDDLVFITGEFEMMQAFLSASGASYRSSASKNGVVRAWVRQLRDLAFDVEDCVEFVVHLEEPSRWDWVKRLASSVLMCVAMPPLPLDVAVAEIKRLKVRVEDVSQRNTRYNLIGGDDDSDKDEPAATRGTSAAASTFHALREAWASNGKLCKTTAGLKRLLDCNVTNLQVISLWGCPEERELDAGELGWATTAKKAFYDPEICREFRNRAWVERLAHPFNPLKFLNEVLTQFRCHHQDNDSDNDHANHHRLSELLAQLGQHRYLIVIEQELTSIADWDVLRMYLPADGNNGSRVVIRAKHPGLAIACTGEPYHVAELTRSSPHTGLYAFYPEGSGHRLGMGDLFWKLRHPGVISVLWETASYRSVLMCELYDEYDKVSRVTDEVECEHCYWYRAETGRFKLAEFVWKLLMQAFPYESSCDLARDADQGESDGLEQDYTDQDDYSEEPYYDYAEPYRGYPRRWRCGPAAIGRCRKFLSEHDCLVYIEDLQSPADWDLIKQKLIPECTTRGCTVVITDKRSVATHCADHRESRVLSAQDLLWVSDQGGDTEQQKYTLGELVGREFEDFYLGDDVTISVWGIAGVGKSAFVREKFYEFMLQNQRDGDYTAYGWVDVPHPFSLSGFCWRLLLDYSSNDAEAKEAAAIGMMEGQDPTQWCSEILQTNKFLLVVDGLQSKQDWDLINTTLLSQQITGITVVITREESIAAHCATRKSCIYNLDVLRDDHALDLFQKIANFTDEERGELSPHGAEILNLIVSKCGGLPEVITAMGGEIRRQGSLDVSLLEHMNADFMGILEIIPSLRGIFCWMQSYFDAFSDELKRCIFYMSVFQVDQSIRPRRLLRRWIAERYSVEEKGERLLSQLMKISMVYQDQPRSSRRSYKVNGFFHEYMKSRDSRQMEDNPVIALDGSCSPSSGLMARHLTISSSWVRDEIEFNDLDLSRLRSLTVFGEWRSFLICEKMKLLRVLDLEGTGTSDVTTSVTDEDLERVAKLLSRIKFLSLRGCVHITRLPEALGDMRQLETLDAKHTSIVELPPAIISKLHRLQYVRVGTLTDTKILLLQTQTSTSSTQTEPLPTQTQPPPPSTPPPTPPQENSHGGTTPFLHATAATVATVVQGASSKITVGWKRRARNLVASSRNIYCQSKNQPELRTRSRVAANGGGVELGHAAAEGIRRLTYLHTLGVVNVAGGTGAFLFLKELKKLTKLRKLGLSGIGHKNWSQLCDAISGNLHHLESLSLHLMLLEEGGSYDFACFHNMDTPPKTLRRLKVLCTSTPTPTPGGYAGGISIRPVWLKKLPNLEPFKDELTISSQDDLCHLFDTLEKSGLNSHRLRVKPIQQQQLSFNENIAHSVLMLLDALRIDCTSSSSTVTFEESCRICVEVLNITCCSSCGSPSCLRISGLEHILTLKQIRVTGSCSQDLKEDLLKQLGRSYEPSSIELLFL